MYIFLRCKIAYCILYDISINIYLYSVNNHEFLYCLPCNEIAMKIPRFIIFSIDKESNILVPQSLWTSVFIYLAIQYNIQYNLYKYLYLIIFIYKRIDRIIR